MNTPLFITGFLRSGTTLLEKYLHNHPQVAVASQPFPFLFYAVKEAFYRQLCVEAPRYPLGHLLGENLYRREQFLEFVLRYRLDVQAVQAVMKRMRGYSGQMMPALLDEPVAKGTLFEIYCDYSERYPRLLQKPNARCAGSKEVFCEEFIPYFLLADVPVMLIIRDPRAVVASIHGGRGATYANAGLSILNILRSWRKSVAYAIHHSGHPKFNLIRYEQLSEAPQQVLQPLEHALGLDPFPESVLRGVLRAQDGSLWHGNSSFESPMITSPRYQQLLNPETIALINALCGAEMAWLGIPLVAGDPEQVIELFRDTFQAGQPALSAVDKRIEMERLLMIGNEPAEEQTEPEAESWFVYSSVQPVLHRALQKETATRE